MLIVSTAMAQQMPKFSVVSFGERPFDTAANDERYKEFDGNGELFSIIKLASNNPDDDLRAYSFDFSLCEHRVKTVNDEVWVYVQRNAMHVTIKRAGYRTLKYELNTTVQPGKVYEMVLSAEALQVYREMLQFKITPANVKATIMFRKDISGSQQELFGITDEEGSAAKSLELGTYVYEVFTDNYHKSEGRIELTENNGMHVENVVLRPKFSTITLEAGEGVDIYLNSEKVGRGSWSGILNAGTYTVECRKDKHKSVTESITVTENHDARIRLKAPVPIVGSLSLISRPGSANITIDGKEYGAAPRIINDLLIGEHTVTVSRTNYKPETFKVEILENNVVEKVVELNNIAKMTISSKPSAATLYIDGKRVGATPHISQMASGDYNLRIVKKGYRTFEKTVHLDSSSPNVSYSLKRQLQNKYSGYIEAAGSVGGFMGVGYNVGCYLYNVNLETFGMFGLAPATIYANRPDGKGYTKYIMSPLSFGGRVGYGVILGSRFRLTPQFGVGCLVAGSGDARLSAVTLSGALRCECAIVKHFGVSLTPEYSYAISKQPLYKEFTAASSKINGWGTGFNLRAGLYFYF